MHRPRAESLRRAGLNGLVLLVLLAVGTGCQTPPAAPPLEIPWTQPLVFRTWTYESGTTLQGAYHSYKSGNVTVITDTGEKRLLPLNQLRPVDRDWVQTQLARPHGLINDVNLVEWQTDRPVFQVNASFFPKGNLTLSPVVYVQYLLRDVRGRLHKRLAEPVVLYPTRGKQNHDLMATTVLKPCRGTNELYAADIKLAAYRAVLLLPQDRGGPLVLDVYANQNDLRLKAQGIPPDWWDPQYPYGDWTAGGSKP